MAKPTILVVDDEVFFRRLFADILAEEALYEVETADSGEQALERIAEGGVDIVVSDMVMPGIGGLDLLRRSRSCDNPPDLILATSNASIESAIQALKIGARDYLTKPCTPEQLRHTVRNCLEQRRLLDENTLLRTQIRLYQKGQNLSSQLEIEELFKEALVALLNEIGAGRGLAFLFARKEISHLTSSPGIEAETLRSLAAGLAPRLGAPHQAVMLTAGDLSGIDDLPEDLRSVWLFPLHGVHDMQGAIALCNPAGADLPVPLPVKHLTFLAEQIALGFQNACQYQSTRELIYTDDLTGLFNHRYLHIALDQEVRRAERYGLQFSLAFIDLDLFKQVNDTHGHLVGSNLLKEVGQILRYCVRDADLLFRYGGDEFTALLVETDTGGAEVVAERIRREIDAHVFSVDGKQTCRITATVGHATYPVHAGSRKDLIELADRAMYQGKHLRNTTCGASDIARD